MSPSFISWEDLNENIAEVSCVAWEDGQKVLRENSGLSKSTVELQIQVGPTTAISTDYSSKALEESFNTAIQFWAGFDQLPFNAYFFSFDDLNWVIDQYIGHGATEEYAIAAAQQKCPKKSTDSGVREKCGAAGMTTTTGNNPVHISQFGVDKEDSDSYRAYKKLQIIHEYTHGVQTSPWGHLSNPAYAKRSTSPCWLGEGNAVFTGYAAGTTDYESYLDERSAKVNMEQFTDYSTSRILEYYNDNTIVTSYEEGEACRENSDFNLAYSIGFLTVEALSAISGSTSSMYLYKYMGSGKTFEEAFEIIYGSSWEEAKPILASYVSSTMGQINSLTLIAIANPIAGGTVTGGGRYPSGASVPLVATPNPGYYLRGWTTQRGTRCQPAVSMTCTIIIEGHLHTGGDMTVKADFSYFSLTK